ncbi:hypothetical protein DLAC_11110 [Tieghemostelium lacteum]|uniref:ILEI/PANDER domain-containing protein n=1 Tax=Tieghemostelium lacteum TaxID=361077 RepID=A0A151Z388_TIELA|nr:hypothetical protein DLAC_11110 [Tieghemostelium lacteum]|eukprot:KYQ88409.1 hypothetical protein DLAC_11110 [Tieghemostelium lacteum]
MSITCKLVTSNSVNEAGFYKNGEKLDQYRLANGFNVLVKSSRSTAANGCEFDYTQYGVEEYNQSLGSYIENLESGTLVMVIAIGSIASIHKVVLTALKSCGSFDIVYHKDAVSFAMVGYKGLNIGSAKEVYGTLNDPLKSVEQLVEYPQNDLTKNTLNFKLFSGGKLSFFSCDLHLNGDVIMNNEQCDEGFNVVTFTKDLLIATHQSFNTSQSHDILDRFIMTLKGIHSDVLVLVFNNNSNDATHNLNAEALSVLQNNYGSRYIEQFKGFPGGTGAWYMLSKNGQSSSILENCTPLDHILRFKYVKTDKADGIDISVGSCRKELNPLYNNYITVNSVDVKNIQPDGSGFAVVVVNEITGQVIHSKVYDLSYGNIRSELQKFIQDSVSVGSYVVLAASKIQYDLLMSPILLDSIKALGSALIENLTSGSSYCMIGRKGASPGTALEMCDINAVSLYSNISVQQKFAKPFLEIKAQSCGYSKEPVLSDGYARFQINSHPIDRVDTRGWNVLVIDQNNGDITTNATFDTWGNVQASDNLASLLESQPQGRIVALAVKDDGSVNLNQRAKDAIKQYGASMIDRISNRDSYSLIGIKGGLKSQCTECHSSRSPTSCDKWVYTGIPTDMKLEGMDISIHSQGSPGSSSGGNALITIDNAPVAMDFKPGLNVVFIDANSHSQVLKYYPTVFTTKAAELFLKEVKELPVGTVVLVAVHSSSGTGTAYTEYALKMVGGLKFGRIGAGSSYTLIGIKGGAPGSALEHFDENSSASISAFTPLPPQQTNLIQLLIPTLGVVLFLAVGTITMLIYVLKKRGDRMKPVYRQPETLQPTTPEPKREPVRNRLVRALMIGADYRNVEGNDLYDCTDNIFQHCNQLVTFGYLLNQNVKVITEDTHGKTRIGNEYYKTGPTKRIVKHLIREWLTVGLQPGDTIYFVYLGHGGRSKRIPNEITKAPWPKLNYNTICTLNDDMDDMDDIKGAEFQALFSNVPVGVNMTFNLDSCYSGGMLQSPALQPIAPFTSNCVGLCSADHNHTCEERGYRLQRLLRFNFLHEGWCYQVSKVIRDHYNKYKGSTYKHISVQDLHDRATNLYKNIFQGTTIPILINLTSKSASNIEFLGSII